MFVWAQNIVQVLPDTIHGTRLPRAKLKDGSIRQNEHWWDGERSYFDNLCDWLRGQHPAHSDLCMARELHFSQGTQISIF